MVLKGIVVGVWVMVVSYADRVSCGVSCRSCGSCVVLLLLLRGMVGARWGSWWVRREDGIL